MADAVPSASSPAAETPTQEKARLRRERRAAKITAGGASRLQAISSLQGGSVRDVEQDVPAKPASVSPSAAAAAGTATPDPDEVDISQHHFTPVSQPRLPSPFAYNGASPPPFPTGPNEDAAQDPMMAMLQQMMGAGAGGMPGMPGMSGMPGIPGGPGGPGQPGFPGDLPPGLANMLGAMGGGSAPSPPPEQSSAWIWRIIHAVFALGLAVYIVFQTPFNGSRLSRNAAPTDSDWALDPTDNFKNFFYLFATFEVVLQSSRYFIEKGRLQAGGILSSIAPMLPEPYGGYIRVLGRYSVIYSTVVSDAMVVVFVLGASSWWKT